MNKFHAFGLVFLLIFTSCSLKKQFYIINKYKSLNGKTFIFGKIIDDHENPMPASIIQSANKANKTQADKDGRFSLNITDGSEEVRALWLGYLTYKTKGLKLQKGDSIHVNIKLIESSKPLTDQ